MSPRGRRLSVLAHEVLDEVRVGIVTTDDGGRVTFVNRAAAQLLKVSPDLEDVDVKDLLGLDRSPRSSLGDDASRSFTHPLTLPDETVLDLELSVTRGSDDRMGYFFIFRDVTEEKRRDADRSKFERLVAMGTMVAGFAHEVRNPIAAMRSIAEELAEELRDNGMPMPHLDLLLQMVERIERLVRTSLQFGRPAAPRRGLQRPWIIVSAALAELRPRLRPGLDEIKLEMEPELPDVLVDERQIAQALVVLLQNALDATGTASRVTMRVTRGRPADQVRFEVIDDGPGIPTEIIGQIFDPFFTTKTTGTGLGLSIAQQIVNENGSRLEVASAPSSGTMFSIIVPTDA